ncbi:hypothetical protein [Maribellus sp. YY47]|uniref:hypothetical protein n=1 Tax=Maribellus sp. YY47 TaxID=2929486 RepID=UPI002001A59F|nr:hypothetical protein [Maribellus sp. YY47]MCK3684428.1 hypothetical protein [Maribellus sp. YY47]
MKRWVYIAVLALIAAGGIFWSCQKDELIGSDELTLKKAKATISEKTVEWEPEVCAGSEHEFKMYTEIGTNVQAQQYVNGDWIQVFQMNKTTESPQLFYLTFDSAGKYPLRFKVGSGGYSDPDTVVVTNCDCDDAGFSYTTEDNLDITFSYNHDEEAEVTIEFTFPQVQNQPLNADGKYVAPDEKIYSVNNPKNQTNFTWTGVVSCKADEPTTFEFGFAADCGPDTAKDGKANIWTDAKILAVNGEAIISVPDDPLTDENEEVIGYSIKGSLNNIVYSGCPTK